MSGLLSLIPKLLPLTALKLWPMSKSVKFQAQGQILWYQVKGLVISNTQVKYESPTSYGIKVMANDFFFLILVNFQGQGHQVKSYGIIWGVFSYEIHMWNMKALSLIIVFQLWPMLKFFLSQSNFKHKDNYEIASRNYEIVNTYYMLYRNYVSHTGFRGTYWLPYKSDLITILIIFYILIINKNVRFWDLIWFIPYYICPGLNIIIIKVMNCCIIFETSWMFTHVRNQYLFSRFGWNLHSRNIIGWCRQMCVYQKT